ncbi:hypothetical protein [Solihabitans fulvus]|uniref:hypothetical protein n=1 Tax=Solihabitans fulvus TaxID=1892852 RepID=UPI001661FC5F|nr:hypothetical protein [Solihabitans fulvus]
MSRNACSCVVGGCAAKSAAMTAEVICTPTTSPGHSAPSHCVTPPPISPPTAPNRW